MLPGVVILGILSKDYFGELEFLGAIAQPAYYDSPVMPEIEMSLSPFS
jgi:hypothetical protein